MPQRPVAPCKPPDSSQLHNAALAYLGRFAATEAGLLRVLQRRIDRWARSPEAALWAGGEADPSEMIAPAVAASRAAAAGVVARLAESGAVNDASFAQARARSLARAGRSRRAIGAHLAARGVEPSLSAASLPESHEGELAAAAIHARRRRMGPFRSKPETPETKRREFSSFARAGFSQEISARVLRSTLEEAEALIIAFRASL